MSNITCGVQKDFVKVNKITFQNVKENFGLNESQNYYNVQQRGFAPLKHFESNKVIFKDQPQEDEKMPEVADPDSKQQSTEDMKIANAQRLKNIILQELEEIHKDKKVTKLP